MTPTEPLAFTVHGPIERGDLQGLCARVGRLLEQAGGDLVHCEVGTVASDAVTVDALARLQLAASRFGCRVQLRDASPELRQLVELMGLADVLPG